MKKNLPGMTTKYIFLFSKDSGVRYISHLDLMRTFERALRRSDLPLAYTEGFNPRIRLSFALPLPVGVESVDEPGLLELQQYVVPGTVAEQLNRVLPRAITITECRTTGLEGSLTELVRHASYLATFTESLNVGEIERIMALPDLKYIKKTKSKERVIDLKEHLRECACSGNELRFTVSAGEGTNIRPDEVLNLLCPGLTSQRVLRTRLFLDSPYSL